VRVKRVGVALLALLSIGAAGAATSAGQPPRALRFTGYVEGVGSGPGHVFRVGDGLRLAFRDDRAAGTRYRVCWSRRALTKRCWIRRTGRIGRASKIFTPAPQSVGIFATRWFVGGRRRAVAIWRFYNGAGD
jgi:transposase